MQIRTFWLTLICLSALTAAGFQVLTALGNSDMSRHVQAEANVFLPQASKDGAHPAGTSTPTPTATPTGSATPTRTPTATATTPSEETPIVADLFVDDDNRTGTEDGSAKHPFNTLHEAIAAAAGGDNIVVATGVYTENVRIQGKTINLFGGYIGAGAAAYANGDGGNFTSRNPSANITHIQGDGTDSVVTLVDAVTSTVDGFRITGGTASKEPEFGDYGGGVYVTGGSPTISHNVIEKNDTRPPGEQSNDQLGGGIYAGDSQITILNNIIRNNTAGRGGGIAIAGGTPLIDGNTVQDNTGVSDHGGGLYIAADHAKISHNLIIGNEIGRAFGYGWGGGIIVYGAGSSALLSFNTVTENYAPSVGSGVFIDDGAEVTLDHELIYNNVCPDGGTRGGVGIYVDGYGDSVGSHVTVNQTTVAGHQCLTSEGDGVSVVYIEEQSEVTLTNSIFWDNNKADFYVDPTSHLTATYTLAEGGLAGLGNLSSNPLFANSSKHDYHLQSSTGHWNPSANSGSGGFVLDKKNSPAIDAGNPASPFANEPSPNGGRANLGVYGNTAEASKSSP